MPKTTKQSKPQPAATDAKAVAKAGAKKAKNAAAPTLPNGSPPPTEAPTAKAKKQATPKGEKIERDRSAASETLTALAAKAKNVEGAETVADLAAQLGKGTLSNAGLVKLRDAINAVNAKLREAEQGPLAQEFALANRGVRRLERATRKDAQ